MFYGIGSMYGSTDDKLPEFLSRNLACIGWPRDEAPAIHQLLGQIAVGDIVFVKSFPPQHGLYIKAVGIVDSSEVYTSRDLGSGRSVQWVWVHNVDPAHLGRLNDHYDQFRAGSLYQELGPQVQAAVIDLLVNGDDAGVLKELAKN